MNSRHSTVQLCATMLVMLVTYNTTTHAAQLGVAESGRFLTRARKPFFRLGDTVWLLAQVPSRDELELYLRTRAEQGFTVIQLTAVMGEERVWGTARRTSRGDIGWSKFVPEESLLAEGEGSGRTRNVAMRSSENDAIAVYFAASSTVKLRLERIKSEGQLSAKWTNPATGEERDAGAPERRVESFTTPTGWEDALLYVAAGR